MKSPKTLFSIFFAVLYSASGVTSHAGASVLWDESSQGDLSGDRLAPTPLYLDAGTNSVAGSVVSGDLDYITIHLPAGGRLENIILHSYSGIDATSFIAIQAGSTFTAAPPAPPVSSLLGYTHFGPGASIYAHVGADLMYALGTASGAMGFSAPLTGSDYSFWIQQTGEMSTYQFDFIATPEPATGLLVAVAVAGAMLTTGRRRFCGYGASKR